MLDHTEPEIRRNNVDITLHCYSDDVTGTVNKPAKRNQKVIKEIREPNKGNHKLSLFLKSYNDSKWRWKLNKTTEKIPRMFLSKSISSIDYKKQTSFALMEVSCTFTSYSENTFKSYVSFFKSPANQPRFLSVTTDILLMFSINSTFLGLLF